NRAQTRNAVRIRQLHEIRQWAEYACGITAFIEKVLPLPHHAVNTVIEQNNFDRQFPLSSNRQLLQVHLKAAFARDTNHLPIGKRDLRTNGRRKTEAHSAKTA